MATAKIENYTAEQSEMIVSRFTGIAQNAVKDTVEALAAEMGKTTRSIIAKASRLGVYKKAEKVTKTGEKIQKKEEIATEIVGLLKLSEADVEGLTKATKVTLLAILAMAKRDSA